MRWVQTLAAVVFATVLLLAATPASATHDRRDGIPCALEESHPRIKGPLNVFLEPTRLVASTSTPAGTLSPGAPTAVVVYEETNGVEGIQRDDPFEHDEHCYHGADRLITGLGCARTLEYPGDSGLWDSTDHGCALSAQLPELW